MAPQSAEDVATDAGNATRCTARSVEGAPRKRLRSDAAPEGTGKRSLTALQAALRAKLLSGLHPAFPAPGLLGDRAPSAIATRAAAGSVAASPAAGAAAAAAALAAVAAAVGSGHEGASRGGEAAGTEGRVWSEPHGEHSLSEACAAVASMVSVSVCRSGDGAGNPTGPLTVEAPPPVAGPGNRASGSPLGAAAAEVEAVAFARPTAAADLALQLPPAVGPGDGAAALMQACSEAMERYAPRDVAKGAEEGQGLAQGSGSVSSDDVNGAGDRSGGGDGGGVGWCQDELLLELLAGVEMQGRQGAGAVGELSDAETAEEDAAVGDDAKGPADVQAEVEPASPPPPAAAARQAHLDRVAASLVRRHCTVPVDDPLVVAYGGASRDAVQL